MRTEIKAIRSKPPVSIHRAVGSITFKADDLMDAAILTALAKTMLHNTYPDLRTALGSAAQREYEQMRQGEDFTMMPPRSAKTTTAR